MINLLQWRINDFAIIGLGQTGSYWQTLKMD